jgi:hypothetical protein
MITSQRRELASKINVYYATWTRLGLSGDVANRASRNLALPKPRATHGGFHAATIPALFGPTL